MKKKQFSKFSRTDHLRSIVQLKKIFSSIVINLIEFTSGCFIKTEEKKVEKTKLNTSQREFSTEVELRKSTKLSTFILHPTEKFAKGHSDPNFSYLLSRSRLSDRHFSASERKEK